jgi:amidase
MGPAGGDLTTVEFAALLGERLTGYRRPPIDGPQAAVDGVQR